MVDKNLNEISSTHTVKYVQEKLSEISKKYTIYLFALVHAEPDHMCVYQ